MANELARMEDAADSDGGVAYCSSSAPITAWGAPTLPASPCLPWTATPVPPSSRRRSRSWLVARTCCR